MKFKKIAHTLNKWLAIRDARRASPKPRSGKGFQLLCTAIGNKSCQCKFLCWAPFWPFLRIDLGFGFGYGRKKKLCVCALRCLTGGIYHTHCAHNCHCHRQAATCRMPHGVLQQLVRRPLIAGNCRLLTFIKTINKFTHTFSAIKMLLFLAASSLRDRQGERVGVPLFGHVDGT